ncbi:MAG TPA: asparagine synthase-related protein, partial [Nitrospirota bacterium]
AVSLEARVPYLDNEVVDIALALGIEDRIRGGRTKHVLKEAAKGLLPADIIDRKKKGFDLPLAVWFRGPLRDYIHDTLGGGGKGAYSAVDGRYAGRMLDEHTSGKRDWALPLFSLLVLKEWSDRSGV